MSTPTFKPGDRVQYDSDPILGTVVRHAYQKYYQVRWDNDIVGGCVDVDHLRLIPSTKFKVGDRVQHAISGSLGEINKISGSFYRIYWDDGGQSNCREEVFKPYYQTKTEIVERYAKKAGLNVFSIDNSIPDEDIVKFLREVNSIIQGPQAMKPIKVESKIFVNDVDVTSYSDDQLFFTIQQAEAEIKRLEGIVKRPKALSQRLADLQAGIDALVKYMDSRD